MFPYGVLWCDARPEDFLEIDLDSGSIITESGSVPLNYSTGESRIGQPEQTGFYFHSGVYKSNPNVKAVVHTHAPFISTIACMEDPRILQLHQNSTRFAHNLAVDKNFGGLATSNSPTAEGDRMGKELKESGKEVMIMANHGVIIASKSIDVAFDLMYYLERAAQIQVLTLQTNRPIQFITPEVVELTCQQFEEEKELYAEAHVAAFIRKYGF